MKNSSLYCLLLIASLFAVACEAPTNTNTAANSNAGNTSTAGAAPTKESLLELERKAMESFLKNDTAHFETMLSNNFVSYMDGKRKGRAGEIAMIRDMKCDLRSWNLDDPQMLRINDDTYALAYRAAYDGSCTWEGKTMAAPASVRAASVWHREGGTWKAVFHGETPIVAAGGPASAASPAAPASSPAIAAANTNTANTTGNTAANANTANSNTAAAPAPPAASPNTQALQTMHRAGWEAWKNRDRAWFEANMASNFGLVDPMGGWVGTPAEAIKIWTETMQCQGVTDIQLTDAHSTAVSPTVEILTLTGTANGSCNGQPNGPLYQSNVYVKEGNAWKLAFMFEQPGR